MFHDLELISSRRHPYSPVLISPRARRSFRICPESACAGSRSPEPDPRKRNRPPDDKTPEQRHRDHHQSGHPGAPPTITVVEHHRSGLVFSNQLQSVRTRAVGPFVPSGQSVRTRQMPTPLVKNGSRLSRLFPRCRSAKVSRPSHGIAVCSLSAPPSIILSIGIPPVRTNR